MRFVEPARLERDRMDERRRRQLLQRCLPLVELGQSFPEVGLDQRRAHELVEPGADLLRERRVLVDAVVLAIGGQRLLHGAADAHPDLRARPLLAALDPGLEDVCRAEGRAAAGRSLAVTDEADVDRRDRPRRRVDRVHRDVPLADVGREIVRERPARRVGLDVAVGAVEEAGEQADAGQERRHVRARVRRPRAGAGRRGTARSRVGTRPTSRARGARRTRRCGRRG